jgi:hypothetical protein
MILLIAPKRDNFSFRFDPDLNRFPSRRSGSRYRFRYRSRLSGFVSFPSLFKAPSSRTVLFLQRSSLLPLLKFIILNSVAVYIPKIILLYNFSLFFPRRVFSRHEENFIKTFEFCQYVRKIFIFLSVVASPNTKSGIRSCPHPPVSMLQPVEQAKIYTGRSTVSTIFRRKMKNPLKIT